MKRKNPYQRLKEICQKWVNDVEYRHTKSMWQYPKNKLDDGWRLSGLWERTKAADQLGYDVILEAVDDGLRVKYVKKIPDTPFEIRY